MAAQLRQELTKHSIGLDCDQQSMERDTVFAPLISNIIITIDINSNIIIDFVVVCCCYCDC